MMSRNFTPEQTLIDKLPFDDAVALEELSRRYSYSLYSYCMTKLNSPEDAKRIVRNIFISLWENRDILPDNFSLSIHLYTEVRKAVVQCVNSKLKTSSNIPAIEKEIIPGFSAGELQKAKQPVNKNTKLKSRFHFSAIAGASYEEQWWNKYMSAINLKGLKHGLKSMLNFW
jgi:DNA-directed RNA polymerase specialized sigma24 family protein